MSKFTNKHYEEAHKKLDAIFKNGIFEDASVCFKVCKGQCCSMVGDNGRIDPELPWHIPTMVWNEHIYHTDPENTVEVGQVICVRKDKINCSNKSLICKLHPYYPKRIALRLEDCDFGIAISVKRKHCYDIKISQQSLQKLSDFYKWLYGEFFDNRLAYILSDLSSLEADEQTLNEVRQLLVSGSEIGESIFNR